MKDEIMDQYNTNIKRVFIEHLTSLEFGSTDIEKHINEVETLAKRENLTWDQLYYELKIVRKYSKDNRHINEFYKCVVFFLQIGTLANIIINYNNANDLRGKVEKTVGEFLVTSAKMQAYIMFVTNYLVALVGKKSTDKLSIDKLPPQRRFMNIEDFYTKHEVSLKKVVKIRDQLFSHLDPEMHEISKVLISFNEIYEILCDLTTMFNYHRIPIKSPN